MGDHRTWNRKPPHTSMTITFFDSALSAHSSDYAGLKTAMAEPALVLGAASFWAAALPLAALSLLCVKIWDTLLALASGSGVRPNPLILRHGLARSGVAMRSSARAAQI
jgi:hypothetical protein